MVLLFEADVLGVLTAQLLLPSFISQAAFAFAGHSTQERTNAATMTSLHDATVYSTKPKHCFHVGVLSCLIQYWNLHRLTSCCRGEHYTISLPLAFIDADNHKTTVEEGKQNISFSVFGVTGSLFDGQRDCFDRHTSSSFSGGDWFGDCQHSESAWTCE